ncbi:MAG: chitobiase/beta-hexosaminidase C-terminal domain-containing protein [Magnetococcus sp. YQC-5]
MYQSKVFFSAYFAFLLYAGILSDANSATRLFSFQLEYKNTQYTLGAFKIILTGPATLTFSDQSCTYRAADIGELNPINNTLIMGGVSDAGIGTGVLMACQVTLGTEFQLSHFSIALDSLADTNRTSLLNKLSAGTDFLLKEITSTNHPPSINGTPTTKATPGVVYNFVPTASDADGDALSFSIKNAPPWAGFNTTTGTLSGTPTAKDYGIYGNIVISVTAGTDTVALPAFELSVDDISNPVAVDIPDGTFSTTQNVTLTCQDDGSGCSLLYYTLDGSTPTTSSTLYSAPISVSATTTLKYIAVDKSGRVSDVRTKNFIINKTITPPTVTITYPTDGSTFNPFYPLTGITGSTSDPGNTGIAKVELQITDGVNYMVVRNGTQRFIPTSSWLASTDLFTPDTWKNWDFGTNNLWTSGQTYTITVRVTDKAGNTASSISHFTYTDNIILSGTVLDSNKQPVAGVSITLENNDTTLPKIVLTTDPSGKYLWEVSKSGWSGTITPKKPGYKFDQASRTITAIKTNQLNNDFTATAVAVEQEALAIIMAGGDVNDHLWTATKSVADLAYTTLIKKGLLEKNIRYLSVYNKKDSNIFAPASSSALKEAITNWAINSVSPTRPLILYMVDHGDDDAKFYATKPKDSDPDIITAAMLKEWLDTLQNKTGAKVILIIDACYSGSFLQALKPAAGIKRIVLASTGANEKACFSYDGSLSFSSYFWNSIRQSNSLQESFNSSADAIQQSSTSVTPQHARLDADSDGLYNKANNESNIISDTYLGNPMLMAGISPAIIQTMGNAFMEEGGSTLPLWVTVNQPTEKIAWVWAVVVPPGASSEGSNPIIVDTPVLSLKYNSTNKRYETLFDGTQFSKPGQYVVTFFAQANDSDGWISVPKSVTIQVGKDSFEPDNTPDEANIIVINSETPQHHNTHVDNDADWVKFYALKGVKYQVIASKLEKNTNLVLERYDSDKATRLGSAKTEIPGADVTLAFTAEKEGMIYIKAKPFAQGVFGADTGYDLKVTFPDAPIVIPLVALLTTPDNKSIPNAVIKTGGNETAITDANGQFTLMADSGKSTVDLFDSSGQSIKAGVTVKLSGKTLTLTSTPGTVITTSMVLDVDKSGTVDATDGVLLLRKLNGASTIDTGVVLPIGQTNSTVMTSINAIGTKLDVDQSGTVDATDGVLILRKLNGASTIDTGVVLPTGQTNSSVMMAIDAISK